MTGYPGASGTASKACDHRIRIEMTMRTWAPIVMSEEIDLEVKSSLGSVL